MFIHVYFDSLLILILHIICVILEVFIFLRDFAILHVNEISSLFIK